MHSNSAQKGNEHGRWDFGGREDHQTGQHRLRDSVFATLSPKLISQTQSPKYSISKINLQTLPQTQPPVQPPRTQPPNSAPELIIHNYLPTDSYVDRIGRHSRREPGNPAIRPGELRMVHGLRFLTCANPSTRVSRARIQHARSSIIAPNHCTQRSYGYKREDCNG